VGVKVTGRLGHMGMRESTYEVKWDEVTGCDALRFERF
jgi:hypothetical protein